MAERIQQEPKQFLRTLVHEELGLAEESFPNPLRATLSATVSTAIGGFIPIIPFFFAVGMPAVVASFVISTVAHFAVGAAKSLVTTRSWWASGTEMTIVGVAEAAITMASDWPSLPASDPQTFSRPRHRTFSPRHSSTRSPSPAIHPLRCGTSFAPTIGVKRNDGEL